MNISIFSRLMLGYLFLLALAMGVSVFTIVQMNRVREGTHAVIFDDNVLLDLHKNLTSALQSEVHYEKRYVTSGDQESYDGFLRAWRDFDRDLVQAASRARTPALSDLLERIRKRHAQYQTLFDEEAALRKTNTPYVASLYRTMKGEAALYLTKELTVLHAQVQQSIIDKVKRVNEAVATASVVTLAITCASLVLGVVISLLITRSITLPIARIRRRTAEIGSGVYEGDLKLASPPEIGALAQDINVMSSRLREVDRLKSDFYALMSHELRTPLTSIKEGTALLLDGTGGAVTERQKRILTIVVEESNRLIDLVSSLLDLSRMEAGMLNYRFTTAEVPALIEQAVTEVVPLAEAKRITIEKDIASVPSVVLDPERILQVLRNLIGNALKFTPAGGKVRISVQRRFDGIGVSVADTGPGIPKEQQADVFNKFQQASSPGRAAAGTGLGLAIVRHIIEDHGGWVWLVSDDGKGSTFLFMLPVPESGPAGAGSRTGAPPERRSRSGSGSP